MRIEYNQMACTGWFQCVQRWDIFQMNMSTGKADFEVGEETEDGVFVYEVPSDKEEKALEVADACPENAITVYSDDGTQLS